MIYQFLVFSISFIQLMVFFSVMGCIAKHVIEIVDDFNSFFDNS
jgi:hypothetical protein